jgi:hypothetical protein
MFFITPASPAAQNAVSWCWGEVQTAIGAAPRPPERENAPMANSRWRPAAAGRPMPARACCCRYAHGPFSSAVHAVPAWDYGLAVSARREWSQRAPDEAARGPAPTKTALLRSKPAGIGGDSELLRKLLLERLRRVSSWHAASISDTAWDVPRSM